jgi:hypothetical protein
VFAGRYKDGLRDGVGTIYHVGGGESDAVFECGELSRYIEYRYPCRFGTVIEGRCELLRAPAAPERRSSHTRSGLFRKTYRIITSFAGGRCIATHTRR